MTVVIVKRECPRHPGCHSLGECVVCATEEIRAKFARRLQAIRAAAAAVPNEAEQA